MANTLNIVEVTLAQLADKEHAVNQYEYPFRKKVVRVTDHVDNDVTEVGIDTYKMAIFQCKTKGHPWIKKDNVQNTVVFQAVTPATDSIPTNVSTLFPNWDYTEF